MTHAATLVQRHGGVIRTRDLERFGVARRVLSRHVADGSLERLRPGIIALTTLPSDLRAAITHGGALTCASLLASLGVWVLESSPRTHVWLGPGRHGRAHSGCSCVPHYHAGSPPLASADVVTALLHYRMCGGDEAFFAAFESALRLGLLSRHDRAHVRRLLPRRVRWLVEFARADADSGLESLLRLRLHLLGITLESQVRIRGVGIVDFVIAGILIIEADGQANHAAPDHRHRDLMRDAAASTLGYETLRFNYAQIVHNWEQVQAAILAALSRAQQR